MIETEHTSTATIVKVKEGYIDLGNSNQFRLDLENSVKEDTEKVIIDLSAIQYFDSTALGALTSFNQFVTRKQMKLFLVGCSDQIENVLKVTKIDLVIPVLEDVNTALNY